MKINATGVVASETSLAAAPESSTISTTPQSVQTHQYTLCEELNALPAELPLTTVQGKKPYLPDWQNKPLTHGQVKHQILANGATGYGLITGNGLLAIDSDGPQATTQLNQLGELPETLTWTSGKSGCSQRLYQLSKPLQRVLEAIQFTRQFIDCGGEQLDFRYNRCQSVLPPSWHPETEHYEWIISFADCNIAPAPDWLEALLIDWALAKKTIKSKARSMPKPTLRGNRQPIQGSTTQLWGNRSAPGRIASNAALMTRWNLIRITGKGQTNSVLLEFCRLIKESGVDCETAIAEFRHFAPQIPGYSQYASKASKHDLERGTWTERIVINWFKKDGYSGHLAKRSSDLNQTRQDAAVKRILKAVRAGLEKRLTKVSDWINWIQKYCYRKWGIEPGLKTLYRHLELWHPKKRKEKPTHPPHRVELPRGVKDTAMARAKDVFTPPKPHPKITLLAWQAIATAALPKPNPVTIETPDGNVTATVTQFRKGDRVVVDDQTGLSYCGQVATITQLSRDPHGNRTYKLNKKLGGRSLEMLSCFLTLVPKPEKSIKRNVTVDNADIPPHNQGTIKRQPTEVWVSRADIQRLKIPSSHWLYAICGAAKQRIKADEVDQGIWQQLLSVGSVVNAQCDPLSTL